MPEPTERVYSAKVEEVFSGDDLVLMVDLGAENLHLRQRVRLHGVDTPNAINEGPDTDAGKVRGYVRNITRDRPVRVRLVSRIGGSWVAVVVITTRDGELNLNDDLIAQGFAFKREKAAP